MEIKEYVKKPVKIKAVELTKDNLFSVIKWAYERLSDDIRDSMLYTVDGLIIPTLEGQHLASYGDFIIQGVKGELYPCKPDIFNMTYSEA